MYKTKLFVVSAPSGAGKTSLCNKLINKYKDRLKYSISYTTREPRIGEIDGQDYFFIDEKKFKEMIENNEFLEWAVVHGNYYGTSKKIIDKYLAEGYDVVLDIDPQGARQIKEKYPDAVFIFIVAPSMKELRTRLINRRTESMEKINLRMKNALEEIKYFKMYDYLIVNKYLNVAFEELNAIYLSEHLKTSDIDDINKIIDLEV
ncbi:guanylate kinase [Deferribacter desulfuricans SSM1]|uniref:Guanylate kinase n=1 Tax=Deferribacter desulfuricans (strain DSM 14783 / JCM 11476 / NBRC 101012 / SSM1) TaxID=639282 RepID=D3PE65_DEFDS|nr:guanylate kinase [Deferribacter desulfuricans]BAI80888.1 guanylate kinase [Deferribacter desulfuricans SSM1]